MTDPASPVYLGELPTHGAFGSDWRDIKVHDDHAYIVSEARNHGMQVFDLTQLLTVSGGPITFGETAHYNKVASAHNIVINEGSGFAYIVGASGKSSCSGGLHMVDLANPTSPAFAGCYSDDGYTHDAQCVLYTGPDGQHSGREICLASNEDTVTIVDVTDKANPTQLSRTAYTGNEYTHQGWLTEDQRYFLVDDELDEANGVVGNTRTLIFDVTDLDGPTLVAEHAGVTTSIDHNQYVKGNLSFQANYRSGLRILDISDVANGNLVEVGFFDVWPDDDLPAFNGAWSNYPYFPSGIVVVSGIEQGLFVLQPDVGGGADAAPSVTVTAPADGATVSGTSVLISASASDDLGVAQVEFLVDGMSIGGGSATPYQVTWDSTGAVDGDVIITAVATDAAGRTGTDSITVTVDNVAGP